MNNSYINETISHGTLRSSDLLGAFANTLENLDRQNSVKTNELLIAEARVLVSSLNKDKVSAATEEDVQWVMEDLERALELYAPEGFYFGAHIGDGSDFGFWEAEG